MPNAPSTNPERARKWVVAALLHRGGRILLTQRRRGTHLELLWEFPGGKMEPGESPEEALKRELREELGIDAEVGRIEEVIFHRYPEFDLLMLVYWCSPGSQDPRALDVEAIAWASPAELGERPLLPADLPLARRLASEGFHPQRGTLRS